MNTNFYKVPPMLLMGLFLTVTSARAHHSVAAEFDPQKNVTVHGVVSRVEWINPHVYIFVDVKDENGAVVTWAFESLPTGFLHKVGITKSLLMGQPGEIVTVEANPAKDGTRNTGWLEKITYSDGHFYVLKA